MIHAALPPVAICVLTYGDYAPLARRCLDSILRHCERSSFQLVVGANAVGAETEKYLKRLEKSGAIHRLILSRVNLHKCPMMRRMFEGIANEFIWWFDDDSYIADASALPAWLARARAAAPEVVMWGQLFFVRHPRVTWGDGDPVSFVRSASWYRGLTPPFWEPGGKGEFDFQGNGTGNGCWDFLTGGCWFIRTEAVRQMDWPDRRLNIHADDVLLGEAVRQHGWRLEHIAQPGVVLSDAKRRWSADNG